MWLALFVMVGAAVIAIARGGSWHGFTELHLHRPWLVIVAVVVQILGSELAAHSAQTWLYPTALGISAAAALAFCLLNLRVAGLPLLTLGLLSNALVVGLNTAMPVSIFAASRAGVSITTIAVGADPRHTIAGIGSHWRALGDVIPVPFPGVPEVVSAGDVLVAAGLGELVVVTMRRRRIPARTAAPKPDVVTLFD